MVGSLVRGMGIGVGGKLVAISRSSKRGGVMEIDEVRAIVEEVVGEMDAFKVAIRTAKWEAEEEGDQGGLWKWLLFGLSNPIIRHTVTFEFPGVGIRSLSFSTSRKSTRDSIRADVTRKILAALSE